MTGPKRRIAAYVNATLTLLLALLLIFEEWGWEPLARLLGRLARLPLWGRVERLIASLPPYAALLVFLVPVVALIPVKLLAWYWVAQGYVALGLGLVACAKIVGTAMVARLFTLTQPSLMRMAWFAALYTRWKRWKDALIAQVKDTPQWRAFTATKRRIVRRGRCALRRMARSVRPA